MFEIDNLRGVVESLRAWLFDKVLVPQILVQVLFIAAAFALARLASARLTRIVTNALRRIPLARRAQTERVAAAIMLPAVWLMILIVALSVTRVVKLPDDAVVITSNLLGAWIVIRLLSLLIREPVWARFFALITWSVAALNILDLLPEFLATIDSFALTIGDLRLSILSIAQSVLTLVVLLWVGNLVSRVISRRVGALPNLTPSIQVLTTNLLKFLFVIIAVVASLSTLGIDLTAFAVFSGAVGVGLGFGLQKIVANLFSGIIILLDRSVKPGDVIAIAGTYGWINSLSARYTSVITRDGIEHLIPNEELITQRVENWSYSNNLVRLKAPVGISYKSDVRQAISLCLEAASETPRVLKDPTPVCLVMSFGDSSVDLELRFWISDPRNGLSNVRSEVYLAIWDKFHQHGIEIPYPQRDLHLRTPEVLSVARRDGPGDAT